MLAMTCTFSTKFGLTKHLLRLTSMSHFVRVPAESMVGRISGSDKPKIMIERLPTAAASVDVFFATITQVWDTATASGVWMNRVGLVCDGRSSCFDLYWFATDREHVYAVDVNDSNYVCSAFLALPL